MINKVSPTFGRFRIYNTVEGQRCSPVQEEFLRDLPECLRPMEGIKCSQYYNPNLIEVRNPSGKKPDIDSKKKDPDKSISLKIQTGTDDVSVRIRALEFESEISERIQEITGLDIEEDTDNELPELLKAREQERKTGEILQKLGPSLFAEEVKDLLFDEISERGYPLQEKFDTAEVIRPDKFNKSKSRKSKK